MRPVRVRGSRICTVVSGRFSRRGRSHADGRVRYWSGECSFTVAGRARRWLLTVLALILSSPAAYGEGPAQRSGSEAFPLGYLFYPLIAAPKEARTFISQHKMSSDFPNATNVASVGYGGHFGLYRFSGADERALWQFNFTAALFAQFDLDLPSDDLVNADYTFGFSLTRRWGAFSSRIRLYHQSSHLGDEVLLNHSLPIEWVDINFEALEALLSYDWNSCWRVYGGGEYIVRQVRATRIDPPMLRGGVEYRGKGLHGRSARIIAGLNLASREELGWTIDTSLKAGVELGSSRPGAHNLRILLALYNGHIPYGQFYAEKSSSYGVEMALGF